MRELYSDVLLKVPLPSNGLTASKRCRCVRSLSARVAALIGIDAMMSTRPSGWPLKELLGHQCEAISTYLQPARYHRDRAAPGSSCPQ